MSYLNLQDLVVEYTSDEHVIHAVNGVSFTLERGETLGLVGETGAGKTTIAKAILRILQVPPARIVGGEVSLDGTDLLQLSEKQMQEIRGQKVAMIFQDPMSTLNPIMTVGSQILEVVERHNRDLSKNECMEKAVEMFEMVGIPRTRFKEYPHQFSGGMRQRVVIAMALACRPELLLADEPTTALDVTIQAQVLELIKQLQEKLNTSMILITHDFGVVLETCDKVAVVYAGKIVEYGTKADIFLHPTHPYTKALFDAIPNIKEKADRLRPINGLPPDPSRLPEGCAFHPRCPYAAQACKQDAVELSALSETHLCRCINFDRQEVS